MSLFAATSSSPLEARSLKPIDSLRIETINGKQFIIHQVDPKETLYSISRKYSVAVVLIREQNPTADAGLSVGQLLKVPYTPRTKPKTENETTLHKVMAKETLFSISKLYEVSVEDLKKWNNLTDNLLALGQELIVQKNIAPLVRMPEMKSKAGVHTVTEKETLFSISKMYGASVLQLKTWNNLMADEVKPGQMLYVIQPMYSTTETVPQMEVKQTVQLTNVNQEIKISENIIGSDEAHEKGMAELIEGTEGNRKYFAQHKTVKIGTILKVRNEITNREVFVKVVGLLTASEGTVIKISKSAFDKLGATDLTCQVELIYYK